MRQILLLLFFAITTPAYAHEWVRLSETDQGPRFVDLRSVLRNGHRATVDTELRMKPVIKRREHFDCRKRLMLVDTFTIADVHQPRLVPSGQDWVPARGDNDSAVMLKIACGRQSKKIAR
ncbi:hypothetical protein MOK15_11155 [Sphingobium sp. BYY-5]|uniref:hypothetical protein n=1 Tax=Sphingobium sp. BYY-5 TaxID=2926400 RepID=UPI001FA75D03|nr:hypothetical protein [Sphingobium sp. BYY-5]MCI4590652.1 hypothetical protein [Sphingobium sp. BYY-5]